MSDPLLRVEDLTIQYETEAGKLTAVSDASFEVQSDQYFGLAGESGCGKSTLIRSILGGLDNNGEIESGQIYYKGQEIQDFTEREFRQEIRWTDISFIPQGAMNSLDPLERISDQAREIAKVHQKGEYDPNALVDRLEHLFDVVGLSPDRVHEYPHQFSGGMQQRAIIAMSLLLEPALVIADEPTTALDVIMQDQVFKYFDKIQEEMDTSFLIVTHDLSLLFEVCQRLAIMHGGQVAEVGPVEQLDQNPQHPYSILLQRALPDIRNPNRTLEVIEGIPPETFGEVDFCTFEDRCPLATEECRVRAPPLEPVENSDDNHRVACVRTEAIHKLTGTDDPDSTSISSKRGETDD